MPQFDARYFPAEIFWTLVAFALLYVLLKWLVLPRITAILERRKQEMESEMEQARQLHEQAERLHVDYTERLKNIDAEAKKMFDESERKARAHRHELMQEWKQEMERRKREFREDVELSRQKAVRDIQSKSAELVIAASEKILRQRVDRRQADDAVDEVLRELENGPGNKGNGGRTS